MAFNLKAYQLLLACLFTSLVALETFANPYKCSELLAIPSLRIQEALNDTFIFTPANELLKLYKELPYGWSEIARPVYEMDKQLWSLTKNGVEVGVFELFSSDGNLVNTPTIFKGVVGSITLEDYGKHLDELMALLHRLPENQKYLVRFTHTHPNRFLTIPQVLSLSDLDAAYSLNLYLRRIFVQKHIVVEVTSVTFMEPTIGDLREAKLSFFKAIRAINKKVWKKSTIVSVKNL